MENCHILFPILIEQFYFQEQEELGKRLLGDMSEKDLAFLRTMASFKTPVSTSDIQKKMGVSQSYIQQYRLRLLETELIYSPSYGKLDFSIPYLKEYLA